MRKISKFLLFLVLCLCGQALCAQAPTKEQLLKLFYQAHQALEVNNQSEAISVYKQILRLSPGLPEPYLQLGNLYASTDSDKKALEKACLCYANYLRLRPDDANAEALKSKISDLTAQIKLMESQQLDVAVASPAVITPVFVGNKEITRAEAEKQEEAEEAVPVKQEKKEKQETVEKEAEEEEEPAPDIVSLTDTIQPVLANADVSEDTLQRIFMPLPTKKELVGRWVSDRMGNNGREMWIFDIESEGKQYRIRLSPHSYAKESKEYAPFINSQVLCTQEYDELVFRFQAQEEQQQAKTSENVFGDFSAIVDSMFDVDWSHIIASDDDASQDAMSASSKGASAGRPMLSRSYEFRMRYDGFKLSGVLHHQLVENDSIGRILVSNRDSCVLFKAPADYTGFSYHRITEMERASNAALHELVNRKMKESDESVTALNDLGCLSVSGLGMPRNLRMGVAYFMEASMKNNLFGMLNMAKLYQEGMGVEKDLHKARDLYNKAYTLGYTDAMVMCGDTYWDVSADSQPDYEQALSCYQKAFFRRCPYAAFRLGWLYYEGLGVPRDEQKAWNYYQQAVSMQFADALADVGVFYRDGVMTEKDIVKALEYLNKAAAKGNVKAMYELYQMYLRGEGVVPDFLKAKEWLRKYFEAEELVFGYTSLKSQVNSIIYAGAQ